MPSRERTRPATSESARVRLRSAQAFLEVADLVLDEKDRVEMPGVAAGLAVLAGIAGSDAICARRLGVIHRGDDHRSAAALLRNATPDGKKLASTFLRLIDIKDEAHYGLPSRPTPEGSGRGPLGTAAGRPGQRGTRAVSQCSTPMTELGRASRSAGAEWRPR
jgi:hypothetical protein